MENSDRGFIVETQKKSFIVWAKDPQEQQQWMKDINTQVEFCRQR